jgi:LytS/YehU family sensor histidine kinase
MNTLTSLQELIEVDPPRASRLVDLLGEEFRLFTTSSRQLVIPASRELALCHTHLAIVSMALSAPRQLHVQGANLLEGVGVPPGVLHTLVENGLTHGGVHTPVGARDFHLDVRRSGDMLCLALTAPASRVLTSTPRQGTGTQFVESSLESIFPSQWTFTQGPVDGGWQSTILIPEADARRAYAEAPEAA